MSKLIEMLQVQINAGKIAERDADFCGSLVAQYNAKGKLSDKQWHWVEVMIERATGVDEVVVKHEKRQLPSMVGLINLLKKAQTKLKFPAIQLLTPSGQNVRLYMAGENSNWKGWVQVTNGGKYETNKWYGRVSPDGEWHVSDQTKNSEYEGEIADLLVKMAEHPAETAAHYGKMTGRCCFCNIALDDPKSTAVGYGPRCAKNYGLPWGKKNQFKAEEV